MWTWASYIGQPIAGKAKEVVGTLWYIGGDNDDDFNSFVVDVVAVSRCYCASDCFGAPAAANAAATANAAAAPSVDAPLTSQIIIDSTKYRKGLAMMNVNGHSYIQ